MAIDSHNLGGLHQGGAAEVNELCAVVLSQRPMILVSNRGPVEHRLPDAPPQTQGVSARDSQGWPEPRRGSGSVATAFGPLARNHPFTWVSNAMSEGDRQVSASSAGVSVRSPLPGHSISLRYVVTPRRAYHKYYNVICNPLLWFLQHYLWNPPYNPTVDANIHDAWENGYVPANEAFARGVVAEARALNSGAADPAPVVMGHDYHLYLLPELVRRELPEAVIQHYVHIPWPTPLYWSIIPHYIVRRICQSLCAADIVGFQTPQDRRSFFDTVEEFLPEAQVGRIAEVVELEGHLCNVKVYPTSINIEEVQQIADTPGALEYESSLKAEAGEFTIVRADRAEPNKNIIRGFRAYDLMLSQRPELKGRVKFLAFLVPSRTHVRQYQRYLDEVKQTIEQVNKTHGPASGTAKGWQPIVPFIENNYAQAVAGLKLYDALLVNTLVEGANLVAQEGPVVNRRDGALVLSRSSGAYRQLAEGSLSLAPADVEGTAQALYQALTMPPEERRRRAATLYDAVRRHDNDHWLATQFRDIAALL